MKQFRRSRPAGETGSVSPPETLTPLGAAAAIPSQVHADFRRKLQASEREQSGRADRFVAKHFPDLDGCWARHPEEMEWHATMMYSAGQVALARRVCGPREVHQPRSEAPAVLTLPVSREIASADDPARKIAELVSASA